MKRAILLIAGLLFWLPACGGGGGGGGLAAATLPITIANAEGLAGLVVGGGTLLEETSDGFEQLIDALDVGGDGTYPCPEGGTFDLDSTSTRATLTFDGCKFDFGNGVETFDGSMTVRVVSSSTLSVDFNLSVVSGGETFVLRGDMRITFTDLGFPNERITLTGNRLSATQNGETTSLEDYRYVEDFNSTTGAWSLTQRGTVRSSVDGGTVNFRTLEPLQGVGSDYATSGVLEVDGSGGSVMTLTVVGEEITVRVDEDGDGAFEQTFTTTWEALD